MAGESAREVARRHREKIERLQRSQARWEKGALGEEAVGALLGALPPGWTVLHDVVWPGRVRANIDHVVVGPGGVFVIDTKHWSGAITVDDGVLRQDGRARETTVVSAAEAAFAVAPLTSAITVDQVHPVLCFVADEPLQGWARDVMITSTSTPTEMLLSRPPVRHPTRVAQVAADLQRRLVPAGGASPAAPLARPTDPRASRRARAATLGPRPPTTRPRGRGGRRRRGAGKAVRQLVVLGLFLAVAYYWGLPHLSSVVDRGVEVNAPEVTQPPQEEALTEQEKAQRKKARQERRAERARQAGGAEPQQP